MKLTVIIPVFNEENTISELVDKVKNARLPKKLDKEIIVVNDGSLDKTAKILRKIKGIRYFSHKKNQGKGAAIKTGMKKARGEISTLFTSFSSRLNISFRVSAWLLLCGASG